MAYAVNTSVSIAKTKADIEELIQKAGASQFVSGNRDNLAVIGFSLSDRQIRFVLPLPEKNSPEFSLLLAGSKREAKNSLCCLGAVLPEQMAFSFPCDQSQTGSG